MKLASIERLHSVRAHPNSDFLECGKILGWPVVYKKGDFKEGDLGVFIYPDVLVDSTNPFFSFMEKNHWKVWIAKFRNEKSSGLFVPLSILDYYIDKLGMDDADFWSWNEFKEGFEVSDLIKCVKYEKTALLNHDALGPFPSYLVSMTDEDNLLSNPRCYDELVAAGPCYITLKCDGSSGTFISFENEIHVCSRRLELKTGNNPWWNVVNKHNMVEKLKSLNIAVQFEVVGPGLNGNRMNLKDLELKVFNIKDLNTNQFYAYQPMICICLDYGLPMVQIIKECETLPSFDELVQIANEVRYSNGQPGEGIVIRPMTPIHSEILGKDLSVKIINANYKE